VQFLRARKALLVVVFHRLSTGFMGEKGVESLTMQCLVRGVRL
jgi:peptidoglycan/LPS O-acetylase OafA/YrhL